MKLTQHELSLFMNEDYRENVLKYKREQDSEEMIKEEEE